MKGYYTVADRGKSPPQITKHNDNAEIITTIQKKNTPLNQGTTTKTTMTKQKMQHQSRNLNRKSENTIRKHNRKSKNTSSNQKDNHKSKNPTVEHIKDQFKYEVACFFLSCILRWSGNTMWRIKLKYIIKYKIEVQCHEKSWPFETIRTRSPGINKVFLF